MATMVISMEADTPLPAAYDASANVGSSSTSICGRTYSVRGGGSASVTGEPPAMPRQT
ncbi:MAG: hypothetical protein ACLVJO_02275 [[Clostridium] scindens]